MGRWVGIDVGTGAVKAVVVEGTRRAWRVAGASTVPSPPELLEDGAVRDPQRLGSVIQQAVRALGVPVGRAAWQACLPLSATALRRVEFPALPPRELQQAIVLQRQQYLLLPPGEAVIRHHVLEGAGAPDRVEVLLAGARTAVVAGWVRAIRAAGRAPVALEPEVVAQGRGVRAAGVAVREPWALVDAGASAVKVSVWRGEAPDLVRLLPLAPGEDGSGALREVVRSCEFFLLQRRGLAAGTVVVSGGRAETLLPGLRDALAPAGWEVGLLGLEAVPVAKGGQVLSRGYLGALGVAVRQVVSRLGP